MKGRVISTIVVSPWLAPVLATAVMLGIDLCDLAFYRHAYALSPTGSTAADLSQAWLRVLSTPISFVFWYLAWSAGRPVRLRKDYTWVNQVAPYLFVLLLWIGQRLIDRASFGPRW